MRIITGMAVCLAVVAMCMPQPLMAAAQQSPVVSDVQLLSGRSGDTLLGAVVDQQSRGQAGIQVALLSSGNKLAEAKTDKNGYFAFTGVKGGVYQLASAQGTGSYRVWAPGTAPPSAQQGALIVRGQDTIRGQHGQHGQHGFFHFMKKPAFIAAIVAAGVALPIALSQESSP